MSRTIVYVDGFNLYFGLKSARFKRFYWLDLVALSNAFLKPGQELLHVHYFTARLREWNGNGESIRRQSTYLDALRTSELLTTHEGHFLVKSKRCNGCGRTHTTFEEKMSDVNLAVRLILDACDDRFDTAIVVSGDSDLTTPISQVRARCPDKRVIVAFPPKRSSSALQAAATAHFRIGRDKLKKSQLPEVLSTPDGVTLARPPSWR